MKAMIYMLFLIVCFLASAIGAICGIGGGVIIKPVLDAFGILGVPSISFLSGCTVLAMTTYSVGKSRLGKKSGFEAKTGIPLSAGAVAGGIIGKWMFSYISSFSADKDRIGAVQAGCLIVVTIGTLMYTLYKNRIRTYQVRNAFSCMMIGLILGILSSFLGIGGGPINLIVLFFFFSMSTKTAAENSLYIIFFSQLSSLLSTLITGSVPEFSFEILAFMVSGGIFGGIAGRFINKKISEAMVERLFIGAMSVIILINIYNLWKFTA